MHCLILQRDKGKDRNHTIQSNPAVSEGRSFSLFQIGGSSQSKLISAAFLLYFIIFYLGALHNRRAVSYHLVSLSCTFFSFMPFQISDRKSLLREISSTDLYECSAMEDGLLIK